MERERIFIDYITNKIYKLLVMREEKDSGVENFIEEYIERLFVEMNGAHIWSEYLRRSEGFTVATSTIAYLYAYETKFKVFRREILNSLRVLNKIREECVVIGIELGTL